jgi:hypothetical protein
MTSAKKKTPARSVGKLRDLKSRKDPKGGKGAVGTPAIAPTPKRANSGWIDQDSVDFGGSNP